MPHPTTGPVFDVRDIPFSTRGSWLNVSPVTGLHTRHDDLHLVTHQNGMHAVLRLVVERQGERVELLHRAAPAVLEWIEGDTVVVAAAFESVDAVRLRGTDVALRIADAVGALTPFTGTYLFRDPIDGAAVFTSYESGRRYRVTVIRGDFHIVGGESVGQADRSVLLSGQDGWECVVEEFDVARAPYAASESFEDVVAAAAERFGQFADTIAGWRTDATPAAALAAYVLWSATVAPKGFVGREAVLMSKHWMDKVWSWDHCFNALALAPGEPGFALDQFLLPFDHQDAAGGLPDSITHSEVLYNFVKPPIHGWTLALLRESVALDPAALATAYEGLSQSTTFWLDFRRVAGHVLPHYQHGNDSGWDNSTTFDRDRVIEAPDLAAFLIVQLDVLAGIADELGDAGADDWRRRRDELTTSLVGDLWDGTAFVARSAADGRTSTTSSLLNLLPILAGEHLPREIADALAADIERHLTEWGLATEPTDSAEYESDGYWRGPIWAPSTVLLESGLRSSGYPELADRVSSRFRALCETSGFAENFDAVSGAGLRDRAYTWTASAYLLLARAAVERQTS